MPIKPIPIPPPVEAVPVTIQTSEGEKVEGEIVITNARRAEFMRWLSRNGGNPRDLLVGINPERYGETIAEYLGHFLYFYGDDAIRSKFNKPEDLHAALYQQHQPYYLAVLGDAISADTAIGEDDEPPKAVASASGNGRRKTKGAGSG